MIHWQQAATLMPHLCTWSVDSQLAASVSTSLAVKERFETGLFKFCSVWDQGQYSISYCLLETRRGDTRTRRPLHNCSQRQRHENHLLLWVGLLAACPVSRSLGCMCWWKQRYLCCCCCCFHGICEAPHCGEVIFNQCSYHTTYTVHSSWHTATWILPFLLSNTISKVLTRSTQVTKIRPHPR